MIAMKKQTGKVEMNTVIFKFIPTMEETYEFVDLTKDPTPTVSTLGHCERETPKKPSKERASLNLEMALLIMLLALAVVFGLQIVGGAINDTFLETAGALGIAGGSFEGTLPDSTNNGDGSYTIGWDGGTPPFDVIEDGVVIGDDIPSSPYTYTPMPGTHEVVIEDGDGNQSEPIIITETPYHIVAVGGTPLSKIGLASVSPLGANYGIASISSLSTMKDSTFLSSDVVIAVGDYGYIYKSTDGGSTWTNVFTHTISGITTDLLAVDFASETHGWAVGANSYALRTTDGGLTWTVQTPRGLPGLSLTDVYAVDGDTAYVCGRTSAGGEVFYTTNGGTTWTSAPALIGANTTGISVSPNGTIWLADGVGRVWKSSDNGASWVLSTTGPTTTALFNPRIFVASDNIVYVINKYEILRTIDGGATWTVLTPGTTSVLTDIQVVNSQVWVSGTAGTILRSRDAGSTWETVSSGTTQAFYGLSAHEETP